MSYILAIDQGTTGSTAIIFDETGKLKAKGYREFPQYFEKNGWVEHDADEIWDSVLAAIKDARTELGQEVPISAVGITNQRETVVAWDRQTGKPLTRAIVWQCRRTADYCKELIQQGLEDEFRQRTGLLLDPYFSGTKMHWMLENVPEVRAAAEAKRLCFGTIDSWLIWKLTNGRVHASDVSNASRTLLYNIHEMKWDAELLHILGVPEACLPEVRPSAAVFGHTSDVGVLPDGIPVSGAAGDQQAALFGQACFEPGQTKVTYGTGAFLLMNTGAEPAGKTKGLLTTVAWQLPDGETQYAVEGSIFVAGAAVQWLRDAMGVINSAAESEACAAAAPDSGGTYLVPAFTGLGAPYWDPYARGIYVGITRGTTKSHLVRATLEALAYQTRDVVSLMSKETGIELNDVRIDGGASVNNFLAQFLADILGVSVERPKIIETTALGAAYLAGIGSGIWTKKQLAAGREVDQVFEPMMDESTRENLYEGWLRAVKLAKGWAKN